MQSVSVLYHNLRITKVADFRWEKADASRTQGMCHVTHILSRSTLGKV